MKAWIVFYGDECCSLFHAKTRGKAKLHMLENIGDNDFLYYRAKRLPGLDDKPITYQNAKDAGFEYTHDDSEILAPESEFTNDCRCDICQAEKSRL